MIKQKNYIIINIYDNIRINLIIRKLLFDYYIVMIHISEKMKSGSLSAVI